MASMASEKPLPPHQLLVQFFRVYMFSQTHCQVGVSNASQSILSAATPRCKSCRLVLLYLLPSLIGNFLTLFIFHSSPLYTLVHVDVCAGEE